ncbi:MULTISPECIES: hypothetical protein [Embleya]|nr:MULTISPECIES: hypothetical protein [Embleya]
MMESEKSRATGMWIRIAIYILGFSVVFGALMFTAVTYGHR